MAIPNTIRKAFGWDNAVDLYGQDELKKQQIIEKYEDLIRQQSAGGYTNTSTGTAIGDLYNNYNTMTTAQWGVHTGPNIPVVSEKYETHPLLTMSIPDLITYWEAKHGRNPVSIKMKAGFDPDREGFDNDFIYETLASYNLFRTIPHPTKYLVVLRHEDERKFISTWPYGNRQQ